jgi:hypothetical protein
VLQQEENKVEVDSNDQPSYADCVKQECDEARSVNFMFSNVYFAN